MSRCMYDQITQHVWFVQRDPDSCILGGSRIGFLWYFGFYSVERIATRLKRVYSRDFEISFVKSKKRQLRRVSTIDIIRSSSHEITALEILKKSEVKQNGEIPTPPPFSAVPFHTLFHPHSLLLQACNKNGISLHSYWPSRSWLCETKRIWNVWNESAGGIYGSRFIECLGTVGKWACNVFFSREVPYQFFFLDGNVE